MTRPPSEAQIQHDIMAALGRLQHVRIFRNEVGRAVDPRTNAHIAFGLCVGSSDLIGIVSPHGRFLALEVKSATGKPTPQQLAFLQMVNDMGGIGRLVRSVDEALAAADEATR